MASNSSSKPKPKSQEQVFAGFQELRQTQRAIASKIAEIEMDLKEHDLVIETLTEVETDRRCYRMVGGVLAERTVEDVLPALQKNKAQMKSLIETLTKQLEAKGAEINAYREQHNIRIRGEEVASKDEQSAATPESKSGGGQGVLVAKEG